MQGGGDDIFYKYSVNLPQNPLQAAISGGYAGAGAVQQFMGKRQELAKQQQSLQAGKIALQAQPELTQQKLQQGRNLLQSQAHSLGSQRLQEDQKMHGYVLGRLAELKGLPQNQLTQAYGNLRQHLIQSGVPSTELPPQYNPQVQTSIDRAYNLVNTPFQQKMALQEAKGGTAIQLAAAKQQIKTAAMGDQITPLAKSFQQEEGKKNSDYFDTVANDVPAASKILADTEQMGGLGKQISSQFGAIKGNVMYLTPGGQQALQSMSKFVLDKFEGMTHIGQGSRTIMNTIISSKAKHDISYEAFKNIVAAYRTISQRTIQKNSFASYLKSQGVTDRNVIENIWGTYEQSYPMFDSGGHAATKNIGQWNTFLSNNPHLLNASTAHSVSSKISLEGGFGFPDAGSPTLSPLQTGVYNPMLVYR